MEVKTSITLLMGHKSDLSIKDGNTSRKCVQIEGLANIIATQWQKAR